MNQVIKLPPIWLLVVCVALGPFTMTIVLPANTQIMRDFATEYGVAQLVLTAYLISMAISQLFMGFLSDRFGRRPVMLIGLLVFAIGSLLAMLAPTLETLLTSRMIQGFGTATSLSLSRATVRDVFPREKSAEVLAYISMAMVVVPMIGPVIGGLLTEKVSWRAIFAVLTALGMVTMALVYYYMNETAHRSKSANPKFLLSAKTLLRERAFTGYVISMTFATGMFFSFQAGAPYLVLEIMQRRPSEYGIFFTLTALGYFSGTFCAGRFGERIGSDRMISLALIPIAVGLVLFWSVAGVMHPLALFVPMSLLAFSNGLTLPNALAGAMSIRPELAGTAAGLSGFIQVGIGAGLTFITGFAQNGQFWPLLAVLTLCGIMSLVGALLGVRSRVADLRD